MPLEHLVYEFNGMCVKIEPRAYVNEAAPNFLLVPVTFSKGNASVRLFSRYMLDRDRFIDMTPMIEGVKVTKRLLQRYADSLQTMNQDYARRISLGTVKMVTDIDELQ
ncbi:TPA: hypothetical protein HA251_00405 [Candidatus Woesearchaeota archaeon]|nr:hypothetical protein [Candidatus Woesearchaeota archaeon]